MPVHVNESGAITRIDPIPLSFLVYSKINVTNQYTNTGGSDIYIKGDGQTATFIINNGGSGFIPGDWPITYIDIDTDNYDTLQFTETQNYNIYYYSIGGIVFLFFIYLIYIYQTNKIREASTE